LFCLFYIPVSVPGSEISVKVSVYASVH